MWGHVPCNHASQPISPIHHDMPPIYISRGHCCQPFPTVYISIVSPATNCDRLAQHRGFTTPDRSGTRIWKSGNSGCGLILRHRRSLARVTTSGDKYGPRCLGDNILHKKHSHQLDCIVTIHTELRFYCFFCGVMCTASNRTIPILPAVNLDAHF